MCKILHTGRQDALLTEMEEKIVLSQVSAHDDNILLLISEAIRYAKSKYGPEEPRLATMLFKLCFRLEAELFYKYKWLKLYSLPNDYTVTDGQFTEEDFNMVIGGLLEKIRRLLPPRMSDSLTKILIYILENPQTAITLSDISSRFYMNYSYLSSTFKKETGYRFTEYIAIVRMERACYLLEHSNMKVYEISRALQYHDVDYFHHLFKNHVHMPPMDYKKRIHAKPPENQVQ